MDVMEDVIVKLMLHRKLLLVVWTVLLTGGPMFAQSVAGRLGGFEGESDIGNVSPAGVTRYDAASHTYTITAAGANVWSTTDSFHFVWKKMSGDVSLTADIRFAATGGEPNPHRKAMLMFRKTLDADGVYADAAQHGSGMTALQYRRDKGATTQDIELDISAPEKLRIEKRGDVYTMFIARGGESLHQVGASMRLPLDDTFYVGLGVCSHDEKKAETASFSNVVLEPLKAQESAGLVLYSTLQTVGIEDNFRRALVVSTGRGHMEAPNWTKDGGKLIFDEDGKMMRVAASGGMAETIGTGAATRCNGSHGISPDGSTLAVSCSMPDKPESRVYVVPVGGGTPRLVTEHPNSYFHSWSADGKTIIFTRPNHGGGNIYEIPVAGGEEKALTTGDGISDDPDEAPDGSYIYFNSDRGGTMQIWRMRPDGSQATQVTFDEKVNWTPHISPDGKWMVFISYAKGTTGHPANRDVELRVMSLDEHAADYKKVRTIVEVVGGSGTMNVRSWAPDSKHFAFTSYQMLPAE